MSRQGEMVGDAVDDIPFAARVWLGRFQRAHPTAQIPAAPVEGVWRATVPQDGGEWTRAFYHFASMRDWLERWAAGG